MLTLGRATPYPTATVGKATTVSARIANQFLRHYFIVIAFIVIAAAAYGCGSTNRDAAPPATPNGDEPCWKPAPELPNIVASPAPASRLALSLVAERRSVLGEVERGIPNVVARGNDVGVGVAGRVDYVVTRGAPTLTLDTDSMQLGVPLSISVEVCKPLFGVCPVYGRCNAALDVVTTLPRVPDAEGEIDPPRLHHHLRRGCVLQPIGLDVTPQLRAVANREISRHQARVHREFGKLLSRARSSLQRALGELTRPWFVGGDTPVCFHPREVRYTRVEEDAGLLQVRVAIDGDIVASPSCQADAAVQVESMRRVHDDALQGASSVYVTERVSLDRWTDHVNERLSQDPAKEPLVVEALAGKTHDDAPVLAAWLRGPRCEPLVVAAQATISDSELSLEGTRGLGGTLPPGWKKRFERASSLPFRASATGLLERAQSALNDAAREVQRSSDGRAQLLWEAGSPTQSIGVEAKSVQIATQLTGHAVLRFD